MFTKMLRTLGSIFALGVFAGVAHAQTSTATFGLTVVSTSLSGDAEVDTFPNSGYAFSANATAWAGFFTTASSASIVVNWGWTFSVTGADLAESVLCQVNSSEFMEDSYASAAAGPGSASSSGSADQGVTASAPPTTDDGLGTYYDGSSSQFELIYSGGAWVGQWVSVSSSTAAGTANTNGHSSATGGGSNNVPTPPGPDFTITINW